jgi:hypothetical protein
MFFTKIHKKNKFSNRAHANPIKSIATGIYIDFHENTRQCGSHYKRPIKFMAGKTKQSVFVCSAVLIAWQRTGITIHSDEA